MRFYYNSFMRNKKGNTRFILPEKKILMGFSQRDIYLNGLDIRPKRRDIQTGLGINKSYAIASESLKERG